MSTNTLSNPHNPATPPTAPLRVLLVEDSDDDATLVVRQLRQSGFDVDWRRVDSEDAYLEALHGELDVILADFQMPQFSGMRALSLLREHGIDIPFIVVTGAITDAQAVLAMQRGASDYLFKDRLARLGEAVRSALHERNLRQQARQAELALRGLVSRANCLLWQAQVTLCNGDLVWHLEPFDVAAAQRFLPMDVAEGETYAAAFYAARVTEDRDQSDIVAEEAIRTGKESYRQEFRCFDRYGRLHWLYEDVFIETVAQGRWRLIGVCTDISERRQAESELQRFISRANCLLWEAIVRDHGDRLEWDMQPFDAASAQRFLELDLGEDACWGGAWSKSKHPDDLPAMHRTAADALRSGKSRYYQEFRCTDRHGDLRWISEEVQIEPTTARGIFRLRGICTDVTERKRADEALKASEQLYHSLVESLPLCVFRKDARGRFTFVNSRFVIAVGKPIEQIIGRTDYDLFPKEHADKYREDDLRVMQTGEIFEDTEENVHLSGDICYVSVQKTPVRDSNGRIIGVQGNFCDVTERIMAEQAIQLQARMLAESNEELQQFAYVASHDLQEPLRMVSGYTQLLQRRYKGKLDADADEFIEFACDGVKRMQTLINDLLAYARVGSKGKPFEPTDCNGVLADVLSNLSVAIAESNAVVSAEPLPTLFADAGQLAQLFQNLIGNAIKFRKPEVAPTIRIGCEREGEGWLFRIQDNGIGIEAQYAERIFVIFQRLQNKTDYPGTGIGLAICKKIVSRHKGRIWVESTPGEGTTFWFTLGTEDL